MLTPRPYLSWTQLDLFEKSPERYKKTYLEGEAIPINRGMALGKEIADALETGEATGDLMKDVVIAKFEKLDQMDWDYKATITVDKLEIPLFSRIDTASKDGRKFKEYKTGITKWNPDKVNLHGQITFYAVVLYALTGKIPEDIELAWAVSEADEFGVPHLTGEVRVFKTNRSLADILKMKIRMRNAWQGINKLVEKEIGL